LLVLAAEPAFEFASERDAADALAGEGSFAGELVSELAGELAGESAAVDKEAAEEDEAGEAAVDDTGKAGADATSCARVAGFDTRAGGLFGTAGRVDP
jgi:hypothetical protein